MLTIESRSKETSQLNLNCLYFQISSLFVLSVLREKANVPTETHVNLKHGAPGTNR